MFFTDNHTVEEVNLTKQQEVLLKRLLYQDDRKGFGFEDFLLITDIDPSSVPLGVLNKLEWELAVVTTEKLNEEWDHIIAGFDDPNFDWESATPPHEGIYIEKDLKELKASNDLFGNFIADRLTNEHLSLVVTNTINAHKKNVELMHRLLVTLCNYGSRTCRDCVRQAIDISAPECGCLAGFLKAIEMDINEGDA